MGCLWRSLTFSDCLRFSKGEPLLRRRFQFRELATIIQQSSHDASKVLRMSGTVVKHSTLEPSFKNTAFMVESVRLPEHPCTNHKSVHVPGLSFPEDRTTFMFKRMPLSEYPCPQNNDVRVPSASENRKWSAQQDELYVLKSMAESQSCAASAA